jgi:hypothetical protein
MVAKTLLSGVITGMDFFNRRHDFRCSYELILSAAKIMPVLEHRVAVVTQTRGLVF